MSWLCSYGEDCVSLTDGARAKEKLQEALLYLLWPCLCSAAAAALQLTGMLPCSAVYLCLGTLQATAACQTGASHLLTKTAKGSVSQELMASSLRCGPTYQRPQSVTKGDGVEAVRKWACFASALCSPFAFGNLFQRWSKSWQASTVIDIGASLCTREGNVAAS